MLAYHSLFAANSTCHFPGVLVGRAGQATTARAQRDTIVLHPDWIVHLV